MKAHCQPIVTDANNKRILEWDSSYQIEIKSFRADSEYKIPYQYIVLINNKVAAEYFRHDDSSYLFVRYDTVHQIMQRGLIKLCNDTFATNKYTLQVPVWNADIGTSKELLKDTTIYDSLLSYRRTGLWKETDSLGMIWKGKYKNGLKEGLWKTGTLVCCNEMSDNVNDALYDLFRPRSIHIFKRGIEQFNSKFEPFWPQIKGSWYQKNLLDSNIIIASKSLNYSRPLFSFETPIKFSSYRKPKKAKFSDDIENYNAFWTQEGNVIKIVENSRIEILQVLSISDDELVLKFIK